jgi:hypothetical protein
MYYFLNLTISIISNKIPEKMLYSSFNFLAFKKLNNCNITKKLNTKVKCLLGPIFEIKFST